MTMKKKKQLLCEDNLRHNEYYGMQNTIDNLYQASLNGEVFTDLMSVILQRENILLAYRNIKKNTGTDICHKTNSQSTNQTGRWDFYHTRQRNPTGRYYFATSG